MLNSANGVDYADNIFCKSNFTLRSNLEVAF